MNHNQAMIDYLKKYPPTGELLKFNATDNEQGEIGINTVYSDDTVKEYTNGNKIKEYTFAVVMYTEHDNDGYSNINANEMETAQQFMDWIEDRNRAHDLPEIPGAYNIENLQNMPELAGVGDNNTAKYMFQCRVTYMEERKA